MNLWFEIVKFIFYGILIVLISKYVLVVLIRKIAESINLNAKTVGNITGVATSMPELITVSLSSFMGLNSTSIYNIISSNIINLIQYILAVIFNRNIKELKNKAIIIDIILVITTILIPVILIKTKYENLMTIIIFGIFFVLYYYINMKTHNKYLENIEKSLSESKKRVILKEKKEEKRNNYLYAYIIYLIITIILIFLVGNRLSNVLENLCYTMGVPEIVIGVTLGFITSIPELITFFESQKHYKKTNNNGEGVVEATNNLLTSNIINLFIIQSIGIIILLITKGDVL